MRLSVFALAVAAAGLSTAGQTHHAVNAQFEVGKPVPITGVLTRLDNLNPHAYWRFDVKGANGQIEKWNLESLAPGGLRRAGVRLKEDIRVGETYPMKIYPSRNGTNTGLLIAITINGKEYPLSPT